MSKENFLMEAYQRIILIKNMGVRNKQITGVVIESIRIPGEELKMNQVMKRLVISINLMKVVGVTI